VATTPLADGYTMPGEWTPHERCVIAWPCRRALYGEQLDPAKRAHAATAQAVAQFEPVLMVTRPGDGAEAAAACGRGVDVVECPIDDSWTRDTGAVVVVDGKGNRAGVDFVFNSWGGKYLPYDEDAKFGARMCEWLGLPRYDAAPFVLESGAITVDGEGTLITTEECLLNPNRNPSMTRDEIEDALRTWLGVSRVVWLPHGLVEDADETNGHVDNVAAFAAPGVVLAQTTSDTQNPNHDRLRRNVAVLEEAGLEVIEIDVLPYARVGGSDVVVPPLNFYQANGAAIVPVTDGPDMQRALTAVARALGREVVGVPGEVLAFGGGGVHCITLQVPLGEATA
jgi:agmatine deiminase